MIEQMRSLALKEIERIGTTGKVEPTFIDAAVEFFRTYADMFHHGKEEGILFKELSSKGMSEADHSMMVELANEHALARRTVNGLESLKGKYVAGTVETKNDIFEVMNTLVELYSKHIQKEETQFFFPSMKYFSEKEQEEMLDAFFEFDKNFTDRRYRKAIETLKETLNNSTAPR